MNLPRPPIAAWHGVVAGALFGALHRFGVPWGWAALYAATVWFALAVSYVIGLRRGRALERDSFEDAIDFEDVGDVMRWIESTEPETHELVVLRAAVERVLAERAGAPGDAHLERVGREVRTDSVAAAWRHLHAIADARAVHCTRPPQQFRRCPARAREVTLAARIGPTCVRGPRERPWCCLAAWPDVAFGPCPPLTSAAPCGVAGDRAARQTPRVEIVTPMKSCT